MVKIEILRQFYREGSSFDYAASNEFCSPPPPESMTVQTTVVNSGPH